MDPRLIANKIRKAIRVWHAAENGFCSFCGLPVGHSPTNRCTGLELEADS